MDQRRLLQVAGGVMVPIIIILLFWLSGNPKIDLVFGGVARGSVSAALAYSVPTGILLAWLGSEIDRIREVRRLNHQIAIERRMIYRKSRDEEAQDLTPGSKTEVGSIERHLELGFGLDGKANVMFHEWRHGALANIRSDKEATFVTVTIGEANPSFGRIAKEIKAAYADQPATKNLVVRFIDSDGGTIHGNTRLRSVIQERNAPLTRVLN